MRKKSRPKFRRSHLEILVFYVQWSAALCQLDSDGDGMTNGQELGDPNCVWTEGNVPERTDNITHPGKSVTMETIEGSAPQLRLSPEGCSI